MYWWKYKKIPITFPKDPHANAFTIRMAGGGIKKVATHRETGETGYYPISDAVIPDSVQGNQFSQPAFNHKKFIWQFHFRPYLLTDVLGNFKDEIID